MKSWVKSVFVVSCAVALTVSAGLFCEARPCEADSQVQGQIDELTSKIRANPKDENALFERARLYRSQKKLTLCQSDAEEILKLHPEHASGYWLLAMIAKDKSDYLGGLKWIRETIKREQPNISHLTYELSTLTALNKDQEVIERSNQIERLFPTEGRVFYYRGLARFNLGQPKNLISADILNARKFLNGDSVLAENINNLFDRLSK
jgi:tetratricopeptide (TPR) repeat protein